MNGTLTYRTCQSCRRRQLWRLRVAGIVILICAVCDLP